MTKNTLYDLGKKLVIGSLLLASIPSYSEAGHARRRLRQEYAQNQVVVEKKEAGLEKKVGTEEVDRMSPWIDRSSQEEFKKLYSEYKAVLIKKGKFDEKKEKHLLEELSPNWMDSKSIVKRVSDYLLREKDPEEYLKRFSKTKEGQEEIRNYKPSLGDDEEGKRTEKYLQKYWNMDLKNPDLSDRIYLHELKKLMQGSNPGEMPKMSIPPFSTNNYTR